MITISLIIFAASPTALAWNPMPLIASTISATVISRSLYSLKSMPLTCSTPSGTASEGTKTASATAEGADGAWEPILKKLWVFSFFFRDSTDRLCNSEDVKEYSVVG